MIGSETSADARPCGIYGAPPPELVGDCGTALQYSPLMPGASILEAAQEGALADPPYTIPAAEELVKRFREVAFARLLAVEHPAGRDAGADETRRYGDTAISFCYAS